MQEQPRLGDCLRSLRRKHGWTLQDVSTLTGVAVSTLSKVENDQMSLSYDKLLQVCEGLGIHVTELLSGSGKGPSPRTRRSVTQPANTLRQLTRNYDYYYLATDLVRKRMVPIRAFARARSLEQFGPLTRHAGEEFLMVLKGEIELHTDQYAPVRLKQGESVYIDSTMGHAYLSVGEGDAEMLCICSGEEPEMEQTLLSLNVIEPAADNLD
ncbi:helix-turn-helix transcriptional regulator [Nitratireductor aquimarinus]|uniref:helix-turn-helix domain-containing protein n=1 Tax=Nitratireductor aquimarinus TaxID=889300 RepID=UPI001A8D1D2A|nr:XRE family transcriptional regulator [Nitratireductor aquimarinus]MBN8245711.1 helix-turn-helix transcriptional regulator [Nitratireductor aquimarinus]MBY6134092.1 XRE family transcriptional regulator [Nitratireductor aquimarinus]MCA1305187.1 XRE family transcriptional regulator [Nitratireductor aquimarinus]